MSTRPAVPDPALVNRLGAFALALADRQTERIESATGLSGSKAAAVVSIDAEPGLSVARVATIVGLTPSVAARVVDELARDGLVDRRPGPNRRTLALHLTDAGTERLSGIREARRGAAISLLDGFEPEALATLGRVLDTALAKFSTGRWETDHLCRLCDEAACGGDDCPAERAAVACGAP